MTPGGGDVDLTQWTFWWEFNKDGYLDLKRKIHSGGPLSSGGLFDLGRGASDQVSVERLAPDPRTIRDTVVPALMRALDGDPHADIETAAMIALAKIGELQGEGGESPIAEALIARLGDSVQEVSETAAVSLGIRGHEDAIPLLSALVLDGAEGRAAVGGGQVNFRTRAFAAFGLGLIGAQVGDPADREAVSAALIQAIETDDTATRDLQVACILALGLVPLDEPGELVLEDGSNATDRSTRAGQIALLAGILGDDRRSALVRAHCPLSMVRLASAPLPRASEDEATAFFATAKATLADRLLPALQKRTELEAELQQSAAQVLGLLGDADGDAVDQAIRNALVAAMQGKSAKDQQARRFAAIGLAKSSADPGDGDGDGDVRGRKELLSSLTRAQTDVRPWIALAAGVHGRALLDSGQTVPGELSQAVRTSFEKQGDPDLVGAYAIACGLLRDIESEAVLLERLDEFSQEDTRGYIAIGLGLLGEPSSAERIQKLVEDSKYQPDLLRQASVALGLLSDRTAVPLLTGMLEDSATLATRAALASALGAIGDKRSIDPLITMLENEELTDLARGFAAAALGIVADKEPFPWNAKLAEDLNYRAATETLTDPSGSTGVLDLL